MCASLCSLCVDDTSFVKATTSLEEKVIAWFRFLKQCFTESKYSANLVPAGSASLTSKQIHTKGESIKTTLLAQQDT